MPDFDPDKWLAENAPKPAQVDHVAELQKAVSATPAFDPDAWLAAQSQSQQQPVAPRDLAAPTNQPTAPTQDGPAFAPAPSSGIIPSWLLPKSQQAAPTPEVGSDLNEKLQKNVQAGLQNNLGFQALDALTGKVTGHKLADSFDPTATPGVVGTALSFADPAAIIPGVKIAGAVTSKLGLQAGIKLAEGAAATEAANAVTQSFAKKMAEKAVSGAIEFGAFQGSKEAGEQLRDGEFKPGDIATEALKGAALGLAAVPATTAAALGAKNIFSKFAAAKAASTLDPNITADAWKAANDQAADLVSSGAIKPEDAQLFIARQTQENLEAKGFIPTDTKINADTGLNGLLDNTKFFSDVDKQTGTMSYANVHDLITGKNVQNNTLTSLRNEVAGAVKTLDHSGVDPKQVTIWLQHMEDTPDGDIVFNPNELKIPGKIDRPAYSVQGATDLYHGTNVPFDNLDFKRGGGMAFFADKEGDAARYAQGAGGQRAALRDTEKYVVDGRGTVYELHGSKEVPKEHITYNGKKINWTETQGGQWVPVGLADSSQTVVNKHNLLPLKEGKEYPSLSQKQVEEITHPDHGDGFVVSKNARIIKQSFKDLNILDAKSPEGLEVIKSLQPQTRVGKRLVDAARAQGRPGEPGFSNEFWTSTKANASNHEAINSDVTQPLKAMGYHGIRFQDDMHMTTGLFDNALQKAVFPVMPNPEQLSALQQLRASYTKAIVQNPELAGRTGLLPGYINIQPKAGKSLAQGSAGGIETPSFTLERTDGAWDPSKHESDYRVLLDSFQKKVAKFTAYNDKLPALRDTLYQLQALGQTDAAKRLETTAMRTMGIQNNKDLAYVFSDKFVQENRDTLNQIASQLKDPSGFWNEVQSVAHNTLYANSVFANPRIILSHWVQPETIGASEIGMKNVLAGQAARFTKSGQALIKELMPMAKTMNNEVLEQALAPKATSKAGTVLNSLSNAVGFAGKKILHAGDTNGRAVMMLGAYKQFQNALKSGGQEAVQSIMQGMLPGEQRLVMKSLAESPEDAAKVYALIRQNRSMFVYSVANKSEAFSKGLGAAMPFTTWSRGIAMNVLNDVQEGNIKQLAKRFVYPMLGLQAFASLTGHKLSDNPVVEGFNALHMTPLPMLQAAGGIVKHAENIPDDISKTMETGRLQGTLSDAANFVPGAAPVNRFLKSYDKTDNVAESLGFKKVSGDTALERAIPEVLKKALIKK